VETARAIDAAEQAYRGWSSRVAGERSRILRRLFDLMIENREDLALIMTAEQGKPLAESRGEISYAASFIEWFAEEAKRIYGDIIPENVAGRRILVRKQPIGVFAAITPWNFPSAMITRKAGPAWAAGCTGVIRPASQTPFSALAIGVLAERAGVPAGVCNIVTGGATQIGAELTESPKVRKLSFTGSTQVGAKRPRSRRPPWNWAAMHPSSSSTTRIWTLPSKAFWPPSSATPGRPAYVPIACWSKTGSMICSSNGYPSGSGPSKWVTGA
jgi:succinate-semialdehyde dehydrogenase/glutarate-semialdehyde dehydrogenase